MKALKLPKLEPKQLKNPWLQGGILLFFLLLYILTGNQIFGIAIAIIIFVLVYFEIKDGAKKRGWQEEAIDTVKALVLAVALWLAAGFVLNTPAPLSAVASCSMLPNLARGDFVVVQGSQINAHEISMSRQEFNELSKNEVLVEFDGEVRQVRGSMISYCQSSFDYFCRNFIEKPEEYIEKRGPLVFHYAKCSIEQSGEQLPCVESLDHNGKDYPIELRNDILIYTPAKSDLYARIGDIVHRTYAVLEVDGDNYYLTKGDNNPLLDIQAFHYGFGEGNAPISQQQVKGKVIARIPWLGYFKIFISGIINPALFTEDEQCKQQLVYGN